MTKSGRRGAGPRITLTEGAVRVTWGEKTLVIASAPQPPDAEEPADFTIDMDSLIAWSPPHDHIEISVDELQTIMQAIEAEFDRLGLSLDFE
ncbi:Imm74 family immunity protein [Methylocella sp.]|uniref:Imm74 family immunity protein n=1 Tax=Methylocella sp. TaxID=1978226 RepID=UPI00378355AC